MSRFNRVRLSPTGKFIGEVSAPLRNGPGTIGVVFRKHGIPTAGDGTVSLPTAIPNALNGFGFDEETSAANRFEVALEPGYLYDLEMEYEMRAEGLTTIGQWRTWYRLRNKSTGIYGDWTQFPGQTVNMHQINGNTAASNHARSGSDAVFGLAVTASVDRIQLGFTGATGLSVVPELAFARVAEYITTG